MKEALLITWIESEAGWGKRPDGYTIHFSEEDYKSYIEEYNSDLPEETPAEYSRPEGLLRAVMISDKLFERVLSSDNGICIWENDFKEMKSNNEILFKD